MTHSIGIIGGDGIGPEVVAEALKVVDATGVAYEPLAFDLGGARYLRTGDVLPDAVLGEIGDLDAVLLGAVGTPDVPPGVLERGLVGSACANGGRANGGHDEMAAGRD